MTFSAARSATGAIIRRALRVGAAVPTVQATSNGDTNSGTITVTPPGGMANNDLMVLQLGSRWDDVSPGFSEISTSDWTFLKSHEDPATANQSIAHYLYFRLFQTGDTTWDFDGSNLENSYLIYHITGHDITDPIAGSITGGDLSELTTICPGVISDITKCLLLNFFWSSKVLGGGAIDTLPGTTTVHNHIIGGSRAHASTHEDFLPGGGTGTRTWIDSFHPSERRNAGMVLVNPIEGALSRLLLEDGTNRLLFEDSSGVMLLED